ncbi:MAG: DUF924 domain-containing protein [Gammaproteobacteria bacterium]|nr:DUF924 domain-containing protein [Gammaproteobacteria bacterium]
MEKEMVRPEDILDFWFSEECRRCWFNSSDELDKKITMEYESVWQQARDGALEQWKQTAQGCLALVIILDQFPLNMYRGQAKSFSTEAASREVARYALEKEFDKAISEEQKLFLFLPFMHSEELADQERSVELFTQAGMETRWAEHHRDIVRRYGRFPHRNEALGRTSTEEETAYLNSADAFKG